MKEQFREKIKETSSYTLICDNWTNVTNQSYLGVTVHYLRSDYEIKNGCLGEWIRIILVITYMILY